MESTIHGREIRKDNPVLRKVFRVVVWIVLIALAAFTLIPFFWMISSSLKIDREVFAFPMRWIPETFHWENYSLIWQRVPLVTYFKNTAFIALMVTLLQTLTSSFAAYAFAKLNFKGRDVLFLCYIGTIAVPWQAYMLPLSKAAIATLVIFTFVNTWNAFMGPMIYLTNDENKTIQVGLRRFIQQYSSDFHLIMAASLVSLLPVSIVFLCLQRYFIEGIATSGLKG